MRRFPRGFGVDALEEAETGTAVVFLVKESDDGADEDIGVGGSTEDGGEEGGAGRGAVE